ncbi:MAG: FAD-dependent oxidoreductase [Marinospirillum sp.]|uniref:flavin monoamine oxidase family protein n=1 Tax=Marinospirillum sp. TaxID=2183934 RepID=UPI0019D8EA9A|nr:NAD(P)/FAD-dependent oxidoreductase [Marinospirillum sp.]MBE0508814.1 FAD-dependent oxidoreductase [Marinospirillum sp.]
MSDTSSPHQKPFALFGPDFTFAYDDWLQHPAGLGQLPATQHGTRVAIIGAGLAGMVCGHELMKLGLQPVVYEAGRLGGRLRSAVFDGSDGVIAELGGMRFPRSSRGFYHYVEQTGLRTAPFPNPLTEAAGSTVIELEGERFYARRLSDLPPLFQQVAKAYDQALEEQASFSALQEAIQRRDAAAVKAIWNPLVKDWDERTFYDFIASSRAFQQLSFRHREVFGQMGFGTGGWDSDFPNSMLEILRVNATRCDEDQHLIIGGAEQLPQRLWQQPLQQAVHWPAGTSLQQLNQGAPRPAVRRIHRNAEGQLTLTDSRGHQESFAAVITTCQSWLLTTAIDTEENLFSQPLWMALDRTRYMQSAKTFVMTDRPFWKDKNPQTGEDCMSMTLTDRLTRGTYLFDQGDNRPGVICLSYAWMSDALKVLPLDAEKRVELALAALKKIYPDVDLASHIRGNPITVSWESDPNFLGAFKGALPGHYRYNQRMYSHFMQDQLPAGQRGLFLAGDDISWTPAWAEGAVQTALNAVWGVLHHLGGHTHPDNPGPGDCWQTWQPITLGN